MSENNYQEIYGETLNLHARKNTMNFIRSVLFIWTVFSLSGCDLDYDTFKEKVQGKLLEEVKETQQTKPKPAGPAVVVNGSGVFYEGKRLDLDAPVEEWTKVIGEEPRKFNKYRDIYIWDNIGIRFIDTKHNINESNALQVEFNRRPPLPYSSPNEEDEPGKGHYPLNVFRGYVEIGGAIITGESTVGEINNRLGVNNAYAKREDEVQHFYCPSGMITCSTSIDNADEVIIIYIGTDRNRYKGTIYDMEMTGNQKKIAVEPG